MKKGFTLAEALITLGIIGIIAALTMPAINSARPDAKKVKYLKTYDALAQTIQAFANNSSEYPAVGPASNEDGAAVYDMGKFPLLNLFSSAQNSISTSKSYSGNTKFCKLLAWAFNADNETCSDIAYDTNPSAATGNYFVLSFAANNGVQFSVRPRTISIGENSRFGENIIIDINGDKEPNCLYNAGTCKSPDRFWFFVTADGNLIPADPMGQLYIKKRKNPLKKADLPDDNYIDWASVVNIEPSLALIS